MEGFLMSEVRATDLIPPNETAIKIVTDLPIPHLNALGSIAPGLLYPHQADGVAFLISKGRAILGDDMGLGKTRQAIVGMQVAAPTGMILVVCPASLKLNWRREIKMVDPDAKIEVMGITDDEPHDPRWVIVNYDIVAKNAELLHGIPWSGVILDEAHFIKNNSQRTSHCPKLLGVSNDARAPWQERRGIEQAFEKIVPPKRRAKS
jgi:SWI/SNF-related matrix-associated actin-dependent regulator 1 of chromatin subfamily A